VKAAFLYGKEDLRIRESSSLPVETYGLRLRVLACGICGSDARMYFTGPTSRYIHPVILGHEFTGEVIQTGVNVQDYEIGDLVAVAPLIPCMRCPACERGMDNLCQHGRVIGCNHHGGLSETFDVPGQMVLAGGAVRLPQGMDARLGALTELVGCCLRGLSHLRLSPGDRLLIIGDGPIGLTFLQLAKLIGAAQILTSGRRPARRQLALQLGADEALDANSVSLTERYAQSLDHVIVAASSIEATAEAIDLVRPGGNLLLFSGYTYGTELSLDVNKIHYRELHLHGSIDCTIRDFRQAARLLPQLQMDGLITASYPLEQVRDAFQATRDRDAVKVIVQP
jgi:L-iditol 2-dehydrogenase